MSINYPSFPSTISANQISASQITSSFSGTFIGDGSGLTNIGGGTVVGDGINIIGSGTLISPLQLNTTITASLFGNATTADFASFAQNSTSASYASTAGFSTFAGFAETSNTASTFTPGATPQVTALKVNATTYGFDTLNFPGFSFPPFINLPAVKMVRIISGSSYDTSYFGDFIGVGASGSATGSFVYSNNYIDITGRNISISSTSGSVTGSIGVTGSITGSNNSYLNYQIIQLRTQNTLPAGSLGMLAVSGSDLYFHNGSGWVLK
jgi:hypothetical protein